MQRMYIVKLMMRFLLSTPQISAWLSQIICYSTDEINLWSWKEEGKFILLTYYSNYLLIWSTLIYEEGIAMNRCVGLTWFWNDRRLFHPHSFQLTLIIDKNARAQQWAPAIQLQLPSPHAPQWRQNKMTDWIQNIELKVFKRERKIVLMTLWSANDTLPSLALVWSSRQLRGPFRII